MTQRDLVKVVGVVAASVVAVSVLGINIFGWGDTNTDLVLSMNDSNVCVISTKQWDVRVKKDKKIVWKIQNSCNAEQTVSVVNFRTDPSSSVENCSNPTQGHIAPPFKDGSLDARTKKVGAGPPVELPLRVKNKSDLGDVELTFYYDICLGNTKADPRLIVER